MSFTNRIRLPFKLVKPQFPEERSDYRLANGTTKTLQVVIRKVYEGITDWLPEKLHERLKIALAHDNVQIEGDKYIGIITQDGDYQIDWIDFLGYPLAPAKFKANVTPFNATNSNCGACEEFTQVVCNNDDAGTLDEDTTYTINVLGNDEICCSPVVITLVTFNSTYLDSCTIDVNNNIVIHTKASLSDANGITLVTYRAQCDNGQFDEADIIGNINGTDPAPVCLAPLSPQLNGPMTDTSATFTWTAPSPAPTCGYHWEVRNIATFVLASGDTTSTSVTVTGLPSDADFLRFFVRSNCCAGFDSNYVGPVIFSLPPPTDTETCGSYELENQDFDNFRSGTYIDCNGNTQNINLGPLHNRSICALQNSEGNPVDITVESEIQILYNGLC